jgi:hypothetical protein
LGLYGRCFASLAAIGSNIFVGTTGGPVNSDGVYISTNYGANWTLSSLNNLYVNALIYDGSEIYAGTVDSGVYSTTNNGLNWLQKGLSNKSILALAINGSYLFAGCYSNGLFVSTNNGFNWIQTTLNNITVASLAVNGNCVFAGTLSNGVYFSSNNGLNWTHTSMDTVSYVTALVVNGNYVFAGTYYSGFFVSSNNGSDWIQRNEGFTYGTSLRTLATNSIYIFAGTSGYGVYRRLLSDIIGIQNISTEIPQEFSITQNFPNPFNPSTKIRFQLPKQEYVLGHEIVLLVDDKLKPGVYEVDWNANAFPSGIYFYRISAGKFSESKKMILIK